jgi:hypothetical protein
MERRENILKSKRACWHRNKSTYRKKAERPLLSSSLLVRNRVIDALVDLAPDETFWRVLFPMNVLSCDELSEPLRISSEFDAELARMMLLEREGGEYEIPDDQVRTLTTATLAAWEPLALDARNLARAGSALPQREAQQLTELSAALRLLRSIWHRRGMEGARWLMGLALQFRCT